MLSSFVLLQKEVGQRRERSTKGALMSRLALGQLGALMSRLALKRCGTHLIVMSTEDGKAGACIHTLSPLTD